MFSETCESIFDDHNAQGHHWYKWALAGTLDVLLCSGQSCTVKNVATSHVTLKAPCPSWTSVIFLGNFASPDFPFLIFTWEVLSSGLRPIWTVQESMRVIKIKTFIPNKYFLSTNYVTGTGLGPNTESDIGLIYMGSTVQWTQICNPRKDIMPPRWSRPNPYFLISH